ncbi:O-antigen ligase family protein [Pontibacter sp. 13R65]|uniref:O-antigen ligase family protein n=1 Tax=Pontibacter sp. 13R65 TaxID=3127458 RepID=UPI00301CAFA9
MKINYSFLFIIPIALIMLMDNMFTELAAPSNPDIQYMMLNLLMKGGAALSFGYCWLKFQRMSKPMRMIYFLLNLYVIGMVVESMFRYDTPMVYPHVFQKLFVLYFSFFVYTFYKGNFHLKFSHVVYFIMAGFWLNVLIVNPHTLSISSFTGHERGVHSSSVYMLVIPFLYYLSNYFYRGKMFQLFMALFVLLTIFFFQHRTVWISTAVVLAFYYLLTKFKAEEPINFGKLVPIILVGIIAGIASSAFLFSMHPEIIDKVQASFSDMENFETQGTGGWRYKQWLSYVPFIEENLFLGMRFDGFELPIQFYREDLGRPVFEDGNGHHFHSFYIEILFYTGLAGLFIFLMLTWQTIKYVFRVRYMTIRQIMLLSFILSGFIFGISYVLPVFFYAVLGWAIVLMEEEVPAPVTYLKQSVWRRKLRLRELKENLLPPANKPIFKHN